MATHATRQIPVRLPGRVAAALLAALLSACGGGGGGGDASWLFPLWVPTDVRVVDLDGDGRLDIVSIAQLATAVGQSEGRLDVRRQTALGVFAAPDTYVVGVYPWRLEIADVDGDGALDLVLSDAVTASSSRGAVWWLKQNPASRGRFLPAQRLLETSGTAYGIAVGDVNGDGVPDLAVSAPLSGQTGATLLLQDPAHRGSFFAPTVLAVPGSASAVAVGDLNADGRNDIVLRVASAVVNGVATTQLGVLEGQANGTLGAWAELPSPAVGLNSALLRIADLNKDGTQDVAEYLQNCCVDYQPRITSLYQASAGGGFTKVDTSLAGIKGRDGAVFNSLTGNGRVDFASVGFYPEGSPSVIGSDANILSQSATGTFQLTQTLALPISASRIASGDLDQDGLPDLVVLGTAHQQLKLVKMLQSAATPGRFLDPDMVD